MRKKIIVGNWKMNNTLSESVEFVNKLKDAIHDVNVDVAVCPTFVALDAVKKELEKSNIKVGAQNVHYEAKGAYTGEISIDMLKDIDVDYCIIGHSERRQYFNETDESVNKKLIKLLETNIIPIVCVGENLNQRENNTYFDVVKKQVVQAMDGVNEQDVVRVIIAYEPIWAIGTGKTATSAEAEEMCKYIRDIFKELYNDNVAENVRIQYGGSVNNINSKEILTMPNIDGALVGGASLKLDFVDIINSVI